MPYSLPDVDECAVCELIESEDARLIGSSTHGLAILPGWMRTHGACVVVARRHVTTMFDLSADEMRDIFALATSTARRVVDGLDPDGLHFWWDTGLLAGQVVRHFLIEVVPRYEHQAYAYQSLTDLPARTTDDLDAALRALAGTSEVACHRQP
jgi:diadenosine tetraphosphate (Ap4A) HIT family hydrolase